MNYTQIIKDYLTFNRKEQRGLLVLVILMVLLVAANGIVPHLSLRRPVDFTAFSQEIAIFEKELARFDSMEKVANRRKFSSGFGKTGSPLYDTSKPYPKRTVDVFTIELNAADSFDLQRLNGIGPAFARRILQYRERLGGFIAREQLLDVFGMDTVRYQKIKDHLIVNGDSVKRMDLNRVTFKELMRHPYFPFVISKALMVYRTEHKTFKSLEELRKIPVINDSVYRRIEPYIFIR
jgi:competence ComEA-like helix-hairpin-helix protein